MEPVAVHPDVRARPRVPQALDRQLVPELPDRARQRAGRRRRLLAVRHGRRQPQPRAVVPPDHALRPGAARRDRPADRVAREGPDDAAELDRALGRRPREVPAAAARRPHAARPGRARPMRRTSRSSRRASTRSSARRSSCSRPSTSGSSGSRTSRWRPARSAQHVQRFRAQDRTARLTGEIEKEGLLHRALRREPVHRAAGADLGRQLRARRVRHRRRDGGAGARPARLRVRAEVRACRSTSSSSRRASGAGAARGRHDDRGLRRAGPRGRLRRVLRARGRPTPSPR